MSDTTQQALIGPFGTKHRLVELWREQPANNFTLIGHFATVFHALGVVGTDAAGYYLTSAGGRLFARLETGCN